MGGVWGEVNTMGCLSLTGQQLLTLVIKREKSIVFVTQNSFFVLIGNLSIIWTTALTRPALHYPHNSHSPHRPDTPPLWEWRAGDRKTTLTACQCVARIRPWTCQEPRSGTHTQRSILYLWEPVIILCSDCPISKVKWCIHSSRDYLSNGVLWVVKIQHI